MNQTYREHERIVTRIAKDLEEGGYSVIHTPPAKHFPFPTEGYVPDLLAIKAGENLVIEVKRKSPPENMQRYRQIIDHIEKIPGWRFLVRTIADTTPDSTEPDLIEICDIEEYIRKAEDILSTGSPELSIPYFWNAIIALLRYKADAANIPFSELSDRSLINHLYTFGVIASETYDNLLNWKHLRDQSLHTLQFKVAVDTIYDISEFTGNLLKDIKAVPVKDCKSLEYSGA